MARMETDCDRNFEKAKGFQFFKCSSLARKSLKFCDNVASVWIFFKKLLSII